MDLISEGCIVDDELNEHVTTAHNEIKRELQFQFGTIAYESFNYFPILMVLRRLAKLSSESGRAAEVRKGLDEAKTNVAGALKAALNPSGAKDGE